MNLMDLDGRGVVVTGAARGIGRAVTDLCVASGARVFAVDLPGPDLDEVRALLPAGSTASATDLRQIKELPSLVENAESALGAIDALVHVAGVIVRRDLEDVSEEDWDLQHDVNLKSTFFLCREIARSMRTAGVRGSLVTFTSQGWWTGGFGGSVVYAASKGGVVSLTRGLSRTLAVDGIRVNSIAPGGVDTDMMRDGISASALTDFVQQIPLGRLGQPPELAAAALFLISDASSYITGATLNVSGGQLSY